MLPNPMLCCAQNSHLPSTTPLDLCTRPMPRHGRRWEHHRWPGVGQGNAHQMGLCWDSERLGPGPTARKLKKEACFGFFVFGPTCFCMPFRRGAFLAAAWEEKLGPMGTQSTECSQRVLEKDLCQRRPDSNLIRLTFIGGKESAKRGAATRAKRLAHRGPGWGSRDCVETVAHGAYGAIFVAFLPRGFIHPTIPDPEGVPQKKKSPHKTGWFMGPYWRDHNQQQHQQPARVGLGYGCKRGNCAPPPRECDAIREWPRLGHS